jgi:acetyl esterase/lipase
MEEEELPLRLKFSGPVRHQAASAALLFQTTAQVCLRRLSHGPRCPTWNLAAELGTELARKRLATAFAMRDPVEGRRYLDSLAMRSSALAKVRLEEKRDGQVKGTWFVPRSVDPRMTVLFLHGGGYSFYPRGYYDNLSAEVALAAGARLFALDYRLSPEHRFPSQLEDAEAAYRWLVECGADPAQLVVAGDSAGGNLTLALLLRLRDGGARLPALAVGLSPATDFTGCGAGAPVESELDWITFEMAMCWADWFCDEGQRCHPLVSPLGADLRGLPPIYMQAGGKEILLGGMQEFARRGRQQGVDVALEVWATMNHDFQAFGEQVPEAVEAVARIGEVVASRLRHGRREAAMR